MCRPMKKHAEPANVHDLLVKSIQCIYASKGISTVRCVEANNIFYMIHFSGITFCGFGQDLNFRNDPRMLNKAINKHCCR